MRILVTGASGLLGLNLCLMKAAEHDVVGITYSNRLQHVPFKQINQDLTDTAIQKKLLEENSPDICINCAAMANVDLCERYPAKAKTINADMPGQLAGICADLEIPYIHISTDAVFDGKKGNYSESDPPNPLSMYASTKLEGEQQVTARNDQALIMRVNFYGFSISGKRSLAEFFLTHLTAGEKMNGYTDIEFSPLYVRDLIDVLFEMFQRKLSGLYHVVSGDHLSKYDFGMLISDRFDLNQALITPVSFMEGGLIAKRSPNLTLDINKLLSAGIKVPGVRAGMDRFFLDQNNGLADEILSMAANEDQA